MIFRGLSFELTLSLPYCLLPSITSTSRHFQVSLSRLYALSHLQCFPLSMFSTECNSAIIPLASLRRAEVRDLLWENDVNTTAKTKTKRRQIKSEEEGAKGRKKSCKRLLENSGRSWRYCRKTRTKKIREREKGNLPHSSSHIIVCITMKCKPFYHPLAQQRWRTGSRGSDCVHKWLNKKKATYRRCLSTSCISPQYWINKQVSAMISLQLNMTTLLYPSKPRGHTTTELIGVSQPYN